MYKNKHISKKQYTGAKINYNETENLYDSSESEYEMELSDKKEEEVCNNYTFLKKKKVNVKNMLLEEPYISE